MKSPTQRQVDLVEKITQTLGIEFPTYSKEFTAYTYYKFIGQYLQQYKDAIFDSVCDEDYLHWLGLYENDVWCEYY